MTTLGIVGFGNFGRFMCTHLRSRFNIRVHDRLDIADEAAQLGVKSAPLPEVAASEVLVLAVPVQNMEDVLRDLRGMPRLPELVMDVGSVKVKPLDLMARYLPKRVDIVGTHPMFGPQSGRHGIAGLKVVLCPLRTRRLALIRDFLSRDMRLEVLEMTPEKHDSEMAYIQGLTHWMAKALREIKLPDLGLATPAYHPPAQDRGEPARRLLGAVPHHPGGEPVRLEGARRADGEAARHRPRHRDAHRRGGRRVGRRRGRRKPRRAIGARGHRHRRRGAGGRSRRPRRSNRRHRGPRGPRTRPVLRILTVRATDDSQRAAAANQPLRSSACRWSGAPLVDLRRALLLARAARARLVRRRESNLVHVEQRLPDQSRRRLDDEQTEVAKDVDGVDRLADLLLGGLDQSRHRLLGFFGL